MRGQCVYCVVKLNVKHAPQLPSLEHYHSVIVRRSHPQTLKALYPQLNHLSQTSEHKVGRQKSSYIRTA